MEDLIFTCPYCGRNSYAASSTKQGKFTCWDNVSKHIASCSKNDNSYVVDKVYGPISVQYILTADLKSLKKQYPSVKFYEKLKHLKKKKSIKEVRALSVLWNKATILNAIQHFYKVNNKLPGIRDFGLHNSDYPSHDTVKTHFGTWNNAIAAAGFEPQIQNGFGVDTTGLDNHLYRSKAEAHFADTYLHGKYTYIIEPKYPDPHYKFYDWYIPSLDLYIELDGGIRPKVIEDKIAINKILNRKCLFISTKQIYDVCLIKQYLQRT